MIPFIIFLSGLCWGSFLNLLSYRLVHGLSIFTVRSYCPHCRHKIAWHDNIPVISWLMLRGVCRSCKAHISPLYPFIELATGIIMTALCYTALDLGYTDFNIIDYTQSFGTLAVFILFFSALIASTRTDLEAMVIPQLFSIYLVPVGLLASFAGLTNITLMESVIGAVLGYSVLWTVALLFKRLTGKDGMGIGDMELLAMIGSFLGATGVWIALMIGSFTGLIFGFLYLLLAKKTRATRIPFGPFLALGATIYYFWSEPLLSMLIGS